jgi:hypothetical protein
MSAFRYFVAASTDCDASRGYPIGGGSGMISRDSEERQGQITLGPREQVIHHGHVCRNAWGEAVSIRVHEHSGVGVAKDVGDNLRRNSDVRHQRCSRVPEFA